MVGPVRMRRLFAVPLAVLAVSLAAAPAWADTWTVTDGSSDATTPACNATAHTCVSLRTAIAASEATKELADVINVPAGTITVGSDFVIQSDITVNGTSARANFIDGGGKSRGFRVTAAGIARINHYTIRNGAAVGGQLVGLGTLHVALAAGLGGDQCQPRHALGGPLLLQGLHGVAAVMLPYVGTIVIGPLEHDGLALEVGERDGLAVAVGQRECRRRRADLGLGAGVGDGRRQRHV